jgi:hypothetical protein
MNYRVGRKQKRVVLDENGLEVGKFNKGNEYLAELTCKFLNLEQTLPIDSVSSCPNCDSDEIDTTHTCNDCSAHYD